MSEQGTDRASQLEQQDRDIALEAQANRKKESPLSIAGERCCIDCFEPIPKKRLESKACPVRCIDCQTDHEKMEKMYR